MTFGKEVRRSSAFHDNHPDINNNKLPRNLRGLMLISNLYGRAEALIEGRKDEIRAVDNGTKVFLKSIYKQGHQSVAVEVFDDLIAIIDTGRGKKGPFMKF